MNRNEYIRRLEIELINLPKEEMVNIVQYYNEYFDEAGVENEQEVIRELGHPVKVANQIKADYAVRQLDSGNNGGGKKGISAAWWVVLGILAAPVAFPVALACGVAAFALFIAVWAVAFSLLLAVAALVGSGIFCVIVGIVIMGADFASAILIIGMGFLITGVMLLVGALIVIGTRAVIRILAKTINEGRSKRVAKKAVKGGTQNEE